jgi:Rrf2 family protein
MIKLNRTTEYSLMALSYIRAKQAGELTSAREIADYFDLPFEILAKTLQKLKEHGIIASSYGTRGGYSLSKDLKSISLAQFLSLVESSSGVVACIGSDPNRTEALNSSEAPHHSCEYSASCSIKGVMSALNRRVYQFLTQISLDELTQEFKPNGSQVASSSQLHNLALMHGEEP